KQGPGAIGTALQNTTSAFELGRRPAISSLYFNGSLDEFRVWNKVRTQAEIAANMLNELSANETGLLAYYKFNQGIEYSANPGLTLVTDASSAANNGILANSALIGNASNWVGFKVDAPEGYLIKSSKTNNITAPVNGTVVTDDNNLSDGIGAVNILAGVQTYNGWINFTDTTSYYYKVYPYSNSGTSIVYNTMATVPWVKDSVEIDEFKDVSSFLELTQGSSAWADYNNDGLMDLLLTGGNSYNAQKQLINSITRLYQQNADHSFSIVDKGFPQVSKGSVAWADYNNDGLLDLIISGATGYYPLNGNVAGIITRLYKQNSDNSFTYVSSANFPNVYKSSIAWIDYNNDGDLDLLISGYQNVAPFYITKIYKNMGNDTFKEQTEILFDNVIEGSVAVGDYNKDGFDDVLISGYGDRVGNVTKLYKNNGEGLLLEQENLSLPVSNSPSVNFMDYNNDGYPDILIDDKICKNNQNGGFEEINMDSTLEYDYVSNDIGDFNNDGLPDILITGDDANRVSQEWVYSYLYKQLPNQTFSRSDFSFINMVYGDAKFIDYDNDGNLDVFLSGESYSQACQLCDLIYTVQTKLYKNTEFKKNQKPSIPTNLKYELGQSVKFSWNPSNDLETPSAALTYNIKIGTTKNGGEIVNPTASANNGYKSLPGIGNCGSNTFATYKLKVGQKYYWSVQSVDNGYSGSNFSYIDSLVYDSIPSSNLSLRVQNNTSVLASWKRGNGNRSAVFVKMKYKDATLETSSPIQGTTYLGVSRFLSGPKIENTSWYCVYNGIEDSVLITNLDPYSLYAIHIVEYIEDSGTPRYFRVNSAMKDNYGIFNTNDYLRNTTGFNETCFADFNNDGYLDILNVEPNGGIIEGFLWKNEGDNDFTSSSLAFQTSLNSNIKQINKPVVADFNNDGLMDFVVCGSRDTSLNSTEISFTNLYKNNGDGTFTLQIGAFSKEVCMGSVSWGDFNNDSKVDLLMCGNPWGSKLTDSSITCIFVNNSTLAHTQFDLLTNTNFAGIQDGSAAWADFNNDGYLDFAISGSENDSYPADGILDIARLYRNNKNETFTEIVLNKGKSKRGYLDETCFWNDFDNDGDLDLKIEGDDGFFIVTNNFPDTTFFEGSLAESFFNYSNKADYDNDGDLDEVTGSIQRNNFKYYPGNFASNKKPATPISLEYVNLPGYVQLMWDNISSDETPSSQISYNIRLRKEGSSQWLCAPQTMDDGSRLIPNFGNSPFRPNGLNNFARYNLPEGNYEWQVQAIDGVFSGSEWSEIKQFTVKAALASFTAEPVCLGDTTIFIDNSFSFVGIKEWRWDFGDIPTVTGKMQKHVFQTTGDHTVRLIITNNNLQNDTVYGIAHVEPIPTVSFTADDVCEGLTATIVNPANTNGLIDWIWDFGDGSTSNYFNPGTHTYAEKKNYTIKFKVTGENNCSNTATKTIAIKERPAKPTISESTNNFCPGTEVKLEVTSTTNGLNFQWKRNGDIIDGATNSIYTGKLTAADYSVVVEPGSCSSESNKLTIVTKPAPPKPTILGHGPNVWILACDNMNATNYKWYYNNNLIPGANNYQYVANKNYGDYYVSVNEGGECWTPSDVFKVELPNEIDDLSFENVKVFPNPSKGIFNISLGSNITGEVNVRVVNVLGKVVLSQINSASEFPIDISHLTNGIYYISLMHKNEVIIKKVVKQ
nr:FG-GAP-like repeat-containing protein [Tenuifilaceae bacterium]